MMGTGEWGNEIKTQMFAKPILSIVILQYSTKRIGE